MREDRIRKQDSYQPGKAQAMSDTSSLQVGQNPPLWRFQTLPRFPRTTITVQVDADIKTNVDLAILTPAYTFATPVWGGRLGFNLFIPVGTARTQIDQLVTGAPGPIGFANQLKPEPNSSPGSPGSQRT
jgi:hypothetical protein